MPLIDKLIGENLDDIFVNDFWRPLDSTLTHAQGVGQYYAGDNSSGGALLRGGSYSDGNRSGVYAFTLDQDANASGDWAGFRCVYRP